MTACLEWVWITEPAPGRYSFTKNHPGLQSCAVATRTVKVKNSGGPLDNQTWQTEWKTAPLVKVQLYEYKNQTLEGFVAVSRLYAKFDCSVANQNFFTFSYFYDCETGLLGIIPLTVCLSVSVTISLSRNLYSSHIRYK